MPIERVPIVHKFGIISQSHRLEIQERILAEAKQAKERKKQGGAVTYKSTRPSYLLGEISEEFVRNFKYEKDLKNISRLETQAEDILNRIKLRLQCCDQQTTTDFETIAKSWIDLSLLSQCTGKTQETALDLLAQSVGSWVDVDCGLLPAVMYLCEATLYWLRYRLIREPYLRSSEVKLLKAGELVFDRLLCYYIMGDLIGHERFLRRLKEYNEGFLAESEESYSSYPTIVQCLTHISRTVELVSAHAHHVTSSDGQKETGNEKEDEEDEKNSLPYLFNQANVLSDNESHFYIHSPMMWHVINLKIQLSPPNQKHKPIQTARGTSDMKENLLSSSKFKDLISVEPVTMNHGMKLLAQMASQNMSVLKTMQKIAITRHPENCTPHLYQDAPDFESTVSVSVRSDCMLSGTHPKSSPNEVSDQGNMQPSSVLDELRSLELSIDEDAPNSDHREGVNEQASTNRSERSMLSTTRMQASLEQIKESELPIKDEDLEQIPKTKTLQANPMQHSAQSRAPSKSLVTEEDIAWDNLALVDRHLWNSAPFCRPSHEQLNSPVDRDELLSLDGTKSRPNFFNERPSEARSSRILNTTPKKLLQHEMIASGRSSRSSIEVTVKAWPNFIKWPSDLAIAFTKLLAQIVENGSSAEIRKAALLGVFCSDVLFNTKKYMYRDIGTKNVGLIDLLYFNHKNCEWCWMVRFTALESLMRIYHRLESTPNQDGLRNICWAAVLDSSNRDPDPRVNEARKLGQTQNKLASATSSLSSASQKAKPIKSTKISSKSVSSEFDLFARILSTYVNQQTRIAKVSKQKDENSNGNDQLEETKQEERVRKGTLTTAKLSSTITPLQSKLPPDSKERNQKLSLRDEIQLHSHLCEKPVGVTERNRVGLSRIVEDQWRKSLHVEGPDANVSDSLVSTPEPTPKTKPLQETSNKD